MNHPDKHKPPQQDTMVLNKLFNPVKNVIVEIIACTEWEQSFRCLFEKQHKNEMNIQLKMSVCFHIYHVLLDSLRRSRILKQTCALIIEHTKLYNSSKNIYIYM